LNALLDEAAVLPTSGSRGCTAVVVELVYNHAIFEKSEKEGAEKIPVYRGQVEFMRKEDWDKELKVLVDECSTQEKTVLALPPEEQRAPNAAAAWQKINQVYGRGTMERFHRTNSSDVFRILSQNRRVVDLLTAPPDAPYNVIEVQEGEVTPGSDQAKALAQPFDQIPTRVRRSKKRWAQSFRTKINGYVYRRGNGEQPQTWPLIRKVRLMGPWEVLKTGACLVDLPGVRDANAARAKVSESYLQNCNRIWIVAPIKRAVDDGTAKELLGEQFKRRLLMDGQYGNVSFICTQTDDLEATETMRDHADVAQREPGRWEKMESLSEEISDLEKKQNNQLQEEEDLKMEREDATHAWKDAKAELLEASKDDGGDVDIEALEELKEAFQEAKQTKKAVLDKIKEWRDANLKPIKQGKAQCHRLQMQLKAICATVRNEYSKTCLQDDFRQGLKELYRKDDDEDGGNGEAEATTVMPLSEDFDMDVFCISSNDYLKVMGIKPSTDGTANTFADPGDTQIPLLRSFVHDTTSRCW
jgi:hypothetical protein